MCKKFFALVIIFVMFFSSSAFAGYAKFSQRKKLLDATLEAARLRQEGKANKEIRQNLKNMGFKEESIKYILENLDKETEKLKKSGALDNFSGDVTPKFNGIG